MLKTEWEGSEKSEEGSEEGKEDAFITVREAATIIGVTPRAVRQRIEDGRLHATMIEGRYYVTRAALQSDTNAEDADFLPRKTSGRKRIPSFRSTPVPSFPSSLLPPSAATIGETAITALSDEIAFLRSQLIERESSLRAEMTERESFLRVQLTTRDREIQELHVLMQSTQRLLGVGSEQETDAHRDAPHKRDFWQRLFSRNPSG